jgi:MYXO-CTERM domain-containing protein
LRARHGELELNCENNAAGDPIACDDPAGFEGGSGGCSPTRTPADGLWAALLAALFALKWRRGHWRDTELS